MAINASATYLDAIVTKYVGISGIGSSGDYAGTPIPFTPKWQFAASTDYNWDMDGKNFFVGQTSTYNSHTFSVVGGDAISRLPSYYLLDLRAGVRFGDGQWSLMAYGHNVTNTFYWTNVTKGGSDTITRYTGMPATYGVTLSMRM